MISSGIFVKESLQRVEGKENAAGQSRRYGISINHVQFLSCIRPDWYLSLFIACHFSHQAVFLHTAKPGSVVGGRQCPPSKLLHYRLGVLQLILPLVRSWLVAPAIHPSDQSLQPFQVVWCDALLDGSTAGEPRMPLPVPVPVSQRAEERDEPQQRAGEIHPDSVLHAPHAAVALGILLDVHLAEDAEQGDPQDEEDQVPGPDEPEAQDEGDQVQDGREGGQAADDLGVDPFRVLVLALLGGAVQVDAVEPADGDGEGELHDVDGGEDHVGDGHAEDTHLGMICGGVLLRCSTCGLGVCVYVRAFKLLFQLFRFLGFPRR